MSLWFLNFMITWTLIKISFFLCEQCDRHSKLLKCWETAMCCSSIFFLAKFLTLSLSNSLSYSTIWSTKLMWSHFLNNYVCDPKWINKCLSIFVPASLGRATLNRSLIMTLHPWKWSTRNKIYCKSSQSSEWRKSLVIWIFLCAHVKKNRWKFNAFFPYQLWNFILYYQG